MHKVERDGLATLLKFNYLLDIVQFEMYFVRQTNADSVIAV